MNQIYACTTNNYIHVSKNQTQQPPTKSDLNSHPENTIECRFIYEHTSRTISVAKWHDMSNVIVYDKITDFS